MSGDKVKRPEPHWNGVQVWKPVTRADGTWDVDKFFDQPERMFVRRAEFQCELCGGYRTQTLPNPPTTAFGSD